MSMSSGASPSTRTCQPAARTSQDRSRSVDAAAGITVTGWAGGGIALGVAAAAPGYDVVKSADSSSMAATAAGPALRSQ